MATAYDVNLDLLHILEIACVNGTHQISVRGVSADFRVVKYANTTLIWGSETLVALFFLNKTHIILVAIANNQFDIKRVLDCQNDD